MTAKSTKKKATKKTGKALAKQGRKNFGYGELVGQAASPYPAVSYNEALRAFEATLGKVTGLRAVLHGIEDWEIVAHRAQRLANLTSELSMAAHTLNAAAYAKAEKA